MSAWRDAWYYLRGGVAWTLLEWAMHVFPVDNPDRGRLARAMLAVRSGDPDITVNLTMDGQRLTDAIVPQMRTQKRRVP